LRGLGSGQNQSTKLVFVPLLVALVMAALALPRAVPPRELPLPHIDAAAVGKGIARDHALAEAARTRPLDADVRALGQAIRQFNAAQAGDDVVAATRYRSEIVTARHLADKAAGVQALLELRAVQMEDFLAEVARFERTGKRTAELDELGGTFLGAMMRVGWCRAKSGAVASLPSRDASGGPMVVLLNEDERRAAFKQTWNKVAGVGDQRELALSLDEQRSLYSFYLRHPHAPESQRTALAMARTQTKDAVTCASIEDGERVAALGWIVTKMKELAKIDPSYPLEYARGIALFHSHDFAGSAQAFRGWLEQHPNGPWTLRARNYLLASEAEGSLP
jgi:TolA-binding protein